VSFKYTLFMFDVLVGYMALTGHEVICWDENGKPATARLDLGNYIVEVRKECVSVEDSITRKVYLTVYDGWVDTKVGDWWVSIVARSKPFRMLFIIEAWKPGQENSYMYRLGIAKHVESVGPFTVEDILDFGAFIADIIYKRYSPGYCPTLLTDKLKDVIQKIAENKEMKKYDQGDAFFADHGIEPLETFVPAVIPRYLKVFELFIGAWDEERENLIKERDKAIKLLEKLEKKRKLKPKEAKWLINFIDEVVLRVALSSVRHLWVGMSTGLRLRIMRR